jgi:serine/threonine protein phosphatase PrpC
MTVEPPVFGRPSPAAAAEPVLRTFGDAGVSAWRAEGGSTAWCTLRAASVTGVRHRLAGLPGEDSFAWAHDGSRLVLAVADGLGSVEGSGAAAARAAAAAVETALAAGDAGIDAREVEHLSPGPRPETDPRPIRAIREGVRAANQAAAGGGATTLVLAVLDQQGRIDLARVGDSTAFVVAPGAGWSELFAGPDDESVGTETAALPNEDPTPEVSVATIGSADVLVLATDGVADPWRDGPETVAPSLAEAVAARPGALDLARLADFSRQGCHDDRTIMVVWLSHPVDQPKAER